MVGRDEEREMKAEMKLNGEPIYEEDELYDDAKPLDTKPRYNLRSSDKKPVIKKKKPYDDHV